MGRKGHHAYGFHREVKTRAKHGLRGFMPRNRVTPYECRRHEVRGGGHPPDTGVWKTRKGCKFPFFKRLDILITIPRTSPLACARRLVQGYLFALLAELRPVLRTPFICNFCPSVFQPPRLTATPPIFYVRKTHGEKRLPCVWFPSRGKNSCGARVEGLYAPK